MARVFITDNIMALAKLIQVPTVNTLNVRYYNNNVLRAFTQQRC